MGTTGESPTLSHPEHERVISAVIEAAAGRIKVMPGTGSNSTEEALATDPLGGEVGRRRCARSSVPYYNKPMQEGFLSAFQSAWPQAVDIPICIYNIPGRTAKNIEPETIIQFGGISQYHDGQGSYRFDGSGIAHS